MAISAFQVSIRGQNRDRPIVLIRSDEVRPTASMQVRDGYSAPAPFRGLARRSKMSDQDRVEVFELFRDPHSNAETELWLWRRDEFQDLFHHSRPLFRIEEELGMSRAFEDDELLGVWRLLKVLRDLR